MDSANNHANGSLTRGIKSLIKRILPLRAIIHLMGLNNYLIGEAEIRALKI